MSLALRVKGFDLRQLEYFCAVARTAVSPKLRKIWDRAAFSFRADRASRARTGWAAIRTPAPAHRADTAGRGDSGQGEGAGGRRGGAARCIRPARAGVRRALRVG